MIVKPSRKPKFWADIDALNKAAQKAEGKKPAEPDVHTKPAKAIAVAPDLHRKPEKPPAKGKAKPARSAGKSKKAKL